MTNELWYIIVFLGALLLFWLLTKLFRTIARDFAGGFVIFILIILFIILVLNIVNGQSGIESGVGNWFNNLFQ